MKLDAFEAVAQALAARGVRYIVAGGLAVNAHGYLRFTKDIDLVIALGPDNVDRAFAALADVGYRPAVPVTAAELGDEQTRRSLIEGKGMQVLNLFSDQHRATSVDIFVEEPFDFEAEHERAMIGEIAPGVAVRFVSIPTLIRMKEAVGRPVDRIDVEYLRRILEIDDGIE